MEVLAGEQTPLHIAVCLGLIPLVEKALSDFPKGTNRDRLLLHLAARFISGAYKILIDKGRPSLLTDPDPCGNTPLHAAAIFGHRPMLLALVKRFTGNTAYSNEINKKNHSGNTPLHLAFQFDHPEIVELLLKGGADKTIKNNAQLTAPELGGMLQRGSGVGILEQDVNYWGGGPWRGGAPINSQGSVPQSSSRSITTDDGRLFSVDIRIPLPISLPNSHQPNPETHSLIPNDMATSEEVSRSHIDYAVNSPNRTPLYDTNSFDDGIAWSASISVVDERSEILAWLSPLEPRARHQVIGTRRADNVGRWRMQTAEFQGWCNGPQQEGSEPVVLFCWGDMAVGKTYFR